MRRKIRTAENSIRDKLDSITKSQSMSKYLQDAVVSLRNGRFVVPVKAEYRGEVGGVIHDVSSSGSTLFVEPTAVVEANARIMQLRSMEQAEIRVFGADGSAGADVHIWLRRHALAGCAAGQGQAGAGAEGDEAAGEQRAGVSSGVRAPPAH